MSSQKATKTGGSSDLIYKTSPYLVHHQNRKDFIHNFLGSSLCKIDAVKSGILEDCRAGCSYINLLDRYSHDAVHYLIKKRYILPASNVWKQHNALKVEIETTELCNYKCTYCPRSYDVIKTRIMSLSMFKKILNEVAKYKSIQYITLHGYGEPTVDPLFDERILLIKQYNLKLALYTNGSHLNEKRLKLLKKCNNVYHIVLNFPSANKNEFQHITKYENYDEVVANIQTAIHMDFNVKICVQGTENEQRNRIVEIKKLFPHIEIITNTIHDRAGALPNKYNQHIDIRNLYLSGCWCILNDVHISVSGQCYMCLEDYYKKYILGDITRQSIAEILESSEAVINRKRIWGAVEAPANYLCRNCIMMKNALHYRKYSFQEK